MTVDQRGAETIFKGSDAPFAPPITAEIDRSDPGNPVIRLESGCNEFWLDNDEARAVLDYLQRTLPLKGGEDG